MRAAPLVVHSVACVALACGGAEPPPIAWGSAGAPATRAPVEDTEPEPEPEDGVQVTSTRGHMDPAAVNAGLGPQRAELTGCYTQSVGKRRWLGGHVLLHWEIAASGAITRVLLPESDLGAWPIEKCLLDVARTATFGKPVGGAADLTLPLDFAAPAAAAVWGVEQSARAVGGQLLKLETCASAGGKPRGDSAPPRRAASRTGSPKQATPPGGGRGAMPEEVTITIYVGPHGQPQSVGFASATTVLDPTWADCAEKAALAWQLPDPKGQVTKLAVRYRPR